MSGPLVGLPLQRCREADHRSYSGDRGFDECQWRDRQYRLGLARRVATPRMAVGSAVDEAIGVIVGGGMPDVPGIAARIAADEGIVAERVDEMTVDAISLVRLFTEEVYPDWPAVYAYQYELHWAWAGVPCHAHVDVVFDDGTIADLKTSGKRLETNRADIDEQLTWYAWGMREVHGTLPPRVRFDGLINANPPADVRTWRPNATKPWHDLQWSRRGTVELDALADTVRRRETVRAYLDETGLHLTNGRSVAYACNGCPVRLACPAWAGYELAQEEGAPSVAA